MSSQDCLATGSMQRSRVLRWVLFALILGITCVAWLFAEREAMRPMGATSASETDLDQHPYPVGQRSPASPIPAVAPAFELGGVLADEDPKLGYAMIGIRGSSAALYKVGDQLQHGFHLHAVYPDHVLLELNGKIHTVGLAGSAGIAMPSPTSRTPSITAMSGYPGRQAEVSAPGLLRDAMQYSEVRVSGQLRAIRVSPGWDMQALQRLGLRPGDLIIAVNGKPVEEQPSGERALELLGNQSGGQVTIVRNGSRQDLAVHNAVALGAPLGW